MSDGIAAAPRRRDRAAFAAAWFGLLGGAVAWSAQLVLGDAFAEVGCEAGGFDGISIVLLAITGVAAIVAAAALVVSLLHLRRPRSSDADEPSATRARFMATSGAVASAIFLTLIVMGGVLPHLFLSTCEL
jgi:heme/copper-type cytochrome/quinol oxidase subunit 2